MSRVFEEHDYIGLSEVSSIEEQTSDKSKNSAFSDKNNTKILNFKATELRLGLPGSQSPENGDNNNNNNNNGDDDFNYKVGKFNSLISGAKRGFSDAINGASNNWGLSENGGSDTSSMKNDDKKLQNSPVSMQPANSALASSKAQVVGWPPIRSFRKNSMAINTPKINDGNKDSKSESGCLFFVKVSMDGAPYLRKINLRTYGGYVELSLALEKMFSGFTVGQVDFSKGRLMDNLRHSEYVLTYEDKDSDWMLVGDVPWNMFMETCKRLRIMKSSDAVGLASSRASEE